MVLREDGNNKLGDILHFDLYNNDEASIKFEQLKEEYKRRYMFKNEVDYIQSIENIGNKSIKQQEVTLTYDSRKEFKIKIIQKANPKEIKSIQSAKELSYTLMNGDTIHFILNGHKASNCFNARIIRQVNKNKEDESNSCNYYLLICATSIIKSAEIPVYIGNELSLQTLFIGHIVIDNSSVISDSCLSEELTTLKPKIEDTLWEMSESDLKEDNTYNANVVNTADLLGKITLFLADKVLELEESYVQHRELYYYKNNE
jgi:ribosomal protein S8